MQLKILHDRYELNQKIGEGGMARVYRGRDRRLDRAVAIKVLHSHYATDPGFMRRFLQEAQAAARLQHPGIVEVYDVGQDGDVQYIVMEYVEGSDLKTILLREGALPIEQAVRIAEAVAEALDVAHRNGLIHRDVKPQNILLGTNGQVKITDFGIAKSSVSTAVTETGVVFGTADYISPEQARGQQATPRSDIYALGVTLYELLTGRLPFSGDGAIAVAMQHLNAEPPAPRMYNPRIPPRLEALVLQALSKDPAERPASAREFAQLLRNYRDAVDQQTVIGPPMPRAPRQNGDAAARPGQVVNPRPASGDPRPPRAPLPPPRRVNEPPAGRGVGFGSFLLGLLLVAGVLGLVYLGASGAFGDLFSFATGAPRPRPTAPGASPGPTAVVQVPMPDIIGKTREEAITALNSAQLQFSEAAPRNSDVISTGYVLDQFPPANTNIAASALVTFSMSLGPASQILPDLQGFRPEAARSQLLALGFQVQLAEEASSQMPAGFVTRTDPAPPARPQRGDTVTIYVSVGNKVRMPDVTGLSLDEATRMIEAIGLFVSFADMQGRDKIENFDQLAPNTVVSSVPRGGELVDRGSGVTLGVRAP